MNIVVVGGGTAGWISALFMQKEYPGANVILVHDNNTPIIGVGEGTTPTFIKMMEYIDINIEDLILNCEATIKNGIKFTNWRGDGSSYIHGFVDESDINHILNLAHRKQMNDRTLALMCKKNKVLKCLNMMAIHFNAKKLAEYLENVGIKRGIKIQIGKVNEVSLDDDEFVTELILNTNQKIKTDFVIDCTGFHRLFVDKIYKTKMITYDDKLKTNRAITFFIEKNEPTPPYTEAICMKYGWMWKIPVGERYGCGYIFDSNLISDEVAYDEICEVIGQKPEIRKIIPYKPGYYDKVLNKNTLAVGLSHGFLEPIEATSLHIACNALLKSPPITNRSSYVRDTDIYNERVRSSVQECVDMVYFHYLTVRNDTIFWKNCKNTTNIPKSLKHKLDNLFDTREDISINEEEIFPISSYIVCGEGVDFFTPEFFKFFMKPLPDNEYNRLLAESEDFINKMMISHDECLNKIKNIT